MKLSQWIVLSWSLLSAGTASATVQRAIEVAQPIVTEEGICVCDVTFIQNLGAELWGETVGYTCAASFVTDNLGQPVNRNAAYLAGIVAQAYSYHVEEQALFGDTLKVFIDLTHMDLSKVPCCGEDVIGATLECVLVNATRSMEAWDPASEKPVKARHLMVEFRGSSDPTRSTRTYLFEDLVKTVPRSRLFR